MKIAINGFGRIGRLAFRAWAENPSGIDIVAINGMGDAPCNFHLLCHDSIHGAFTPPFALLPLKKGGWFLQHKKNPQKKIHLFREKNPQNLPWKALGVEGVLECSGQFTSHKKASDHLVAGAQKVIISSPASDADITVIFGLNHRTIASHHHIISAGSCTTNCLAPVAHILHEAFGIERGFVTTVHAYTSDQCLLDHHHTDYQRARSASLSIIPAKTGVSKALDSVLPHLKGVIKGSAFRVPVPNVSLIDFSFTTKSRVSPASLNLAFEKACAKDFSAILGINDLPLVSVDFNHRKESAIIDSHQTQVVGDRFARVVAWYDNEWGFSNRLLDIANTLQDTKKLL